MTNNKMRWLTIVVVLAAAFVWLYPNFANLKKEQWWPTKEKIVLGLDIQGGLHLVMGVDVGSVLQEKILRLSNTLQEEAKEEGVALKSVGVNPSNKNQVIVKLDASQDAGFKKYIENYYPADLQILSDSGGKIVMQYYATRAAEFKKQVISQAIEVIRNRIDEFGVSEPNIAAQGSDRVLVQLPGVKDSARAKELINRTARLDFRKISEKTRGDKLNEWIAQAEKKGSYALGKKGMNYSKYVRRLNKDLKSKLPKHTRVVFERLEGAANLEAGRRPHLIETDSDLSGSSLEDARVSTDEYGKPEVQFKFNVQGRRRFADLTEKAAGGYLAIVLDDVVQSAPTVEKKIDSASSRITLGASGNYQQVYEEAQFIATALRAGALPAALEQLEERTVGPTLGADSIARGKKAGWIGALLVAIFMLVYYRFLGVIANAALVLNIALLMACLSALGATLTLPGVAGILLTVGMAVDANVIIFERIKEELRKGAGLNSSVRNGFGQALSAILDANITTAAICVVLMYFGTGPVKGFAVTLLCGIVTSMFTSIFVSRTFVTFAVSRGLRKVTNY